jgi:hypothetical protein
VDSREQAGIMTGEALPDRSGDRQTARWAAYRTAARELEECRELIARDEKELAVLHSEPVPIRAWHLRAAAETGSNLDDVLASDRQERVSELEQILECEYEMRNRAESTAWEALWEATHMAESDADSLTRIVADAAAIGITSSLANAKEMIRAFTDQIRGLKQGDPIPVTAWHLRAAAEYGQSVDEVLANERAAMITGRTFWIRELSRAVVDGEHATARHRVERLRSLPRRDRSRGESRG